MADVRGTADSRRVLTYDQALRHAVHHFVRNGNVDMTALADEIPVGRATLYRVVGSRDTLLGDVLWILAHRTLGLAQREAVKTGLDRIIEISRRFKEMTLEFEPVRAFLKAEPETAFRVLLTPAGRVSDRVAEFWSVILAEAAERGEVVLPFDVDRFAYIFVRIGESLLYSDLLAGIEPDLDASETVQRLLFRAY